MQFFQCSRCSLIFADETIPDWCPQCRRPSEIPQKISVMGFDVTAAVVRDYGLRKGLNDPQVRKGMDGLRLGFCPHGMVTSAICNACPK